MKLSFTKMQGCANDYIYLDCRTSGVPEQIAALSERLSRRHFSIGADGIICICAPVTAGADAMMRIFNADGSEGKMCGNGIRCFAKYVYDNGIIDKKEFAVETLAGIMKPKVTVGDDGKVTPRKVKVTMAQNNRWLVQEGLQAGEQVMVDGFQKLMMLPPGTPVQAVPWQPPGAAAPATVASPAATASATAQ